MARPFFQRCIASGSRPVLSTTPRMASRVSNRGIVGDASPLASSSSAPRAAFNTQILEGLPGFLEKEQFSTITEWQAGLWSRLQSEVRNNPALLPVKQKWDASPSGVDLPYLLTLTARDPSLTLAFNYGALLLNNSYFLEGLNSGAAQTPPEQYRQLSEKVAAVADGIVGGAWLWLVRSAASPFNVDIVPTFAAGTLLVTNRAQQGRADVPAFLSPSSSGSSTSPSPASAQEAASPPSSRPSALEADIHSRPVQGLSSRGSEAEKAVVPLAVLNLYEHAYLGLKYGVWGRGAYARDWWRSLDWRKVEERSRLSMPK